MKRPADKEHFKNLWWWSKFDLVQL